MTETPDSSPTNPWRRRLAALLRLLIAGVIVAWLLHHIPFTRIVDAVAQTRLGFFALALGTVTISMTLEALRVRIMSRAHGVDASTPRFLAVDLAASFYGLFVPGGTLSRGAIRIFKLSTLGLQPTAAGLVVVRDRLDSTAVLAITGLVFLAVAAPPVSGPAGLLLTGALAGTALLYLLIFAPEGWLPTLPWVRLPGGRRLQGLRESVRRMRAIPAATQTGLFALCIVMHLFIVLTFYLTTLSLDLPVSLVTIGWIRSVVTLVTMIPISFSGIGVREAALLVLLGRYGVSEDQAVAFGFLIFVLIIVIPGLVGGLLEGWSSRVARKVPRVQG